MGIVQHMSVGPETEDEREVKQPSGSCRFAAGLSDQSDNGIVRAQGKVATVFKSTRTVETTLSAWESL